MDHAVDQVRDAEGLDEVRAVRVGWRQGDRLKHHLPGKIHRMW